MAALDESHDRDDPALAIDDPDGQLEIRVEHNHSQTLVAVEDRAAEVTATAEIPVGDLSLTNTTQLARDLRDAFETATKGRGGDE